MPVTKSKQLDWHLDAIAELAESLAWYAKRNPAAANPLYDVGLRGKAANPTYELNDGDQIVMSLDRAGVKVQPEVAKPAK